LLLPELCERCGQVAACVLACRDQEQSSVLDAFEIARSARPLNDWRNYGCQQFVMVRQMLGRIARIAKESRLSRQTLKRDQYDPASAEASFAARELAGRNGGRMSNVPSSVGVFFGKTEGWYWVDASTKVPKGPFETKEQAIENAALCVATTDEQRANSP
jgi:hypothetical protein